MRLWAAAKALPRRLSALIGRRDLFWWWHNDDVQLNFVLFLLLLCVEGNYFQTGS